MQAFTYVTADQSSIVVFARDEQHAIGVYCIHYETRHGRFPSGVCLDARPCSNDLSVHHLEAALTQGVSGVGTYAQLTGWTIRAPDDLVPGELGCCPLARLLSDPGQGNRS